MGEGALFRRRNPGQWSDFRVHAERVRRTVASPSFAGSSRCDAGSFVDSRRTGRGGPPEVMPTALARITPFWDTTPGRCCGSRARGSLCTASAPGTYRRSAGKHGRNSRLVLSAAWALSSVLRDFRDRRRGERFKGASYPTRRGDLSFAKTSVVLNAAGRVAVAGGIESSTDRPLCTFCGRFFRGRRRGSCASTQKGHA